MALYREFNGSEVRKPCPTCSGRWAVTGKNTQVLDSTHDPQRRSWLESANVAECDFPVQNLPFGVFATDAGARGGVAIGDSIVDLATASRAGIFTGLAADAAAAASGTTSTRCLRWATRTRGSYAGSYRKRWRRVRRLQRPTPCVRVWSR